MDNTTPGQPLALPEVTDANLARLDAIAHAAVPLCSPDAKHEPFTMPAPLARHLAVANPLQVLALVAEVRSLREALELAQAQTAEARELVADWQEASSLQVGGDPGGVNPEHLHREWAEKYAAAAPFLDLARARLEGRSFEPIPRGECARFLTAFGREVRLVLPRMPEGDALVVAPGFGVPIDARASGDGFSVMKPDEALGQIRQELEELDAQPSRQLPGTPPQGRPAVSFRTFLQEAGEVVGVDVPAFMLDNAEEIARALEDGRTLVINPRLQRLQVGSPAWLLVWNAENALDREVATRRALDAVGVPAAVETRPGWKSHAPEDRVRWLASHRLSAERLSAIVEDVVREVWADPGSPLIGCTWADEVQRRLMERIALALGVERHAAERCPSCPHPRHLGMCSARNGQTANPCPCIASSVPGGGTVYVSPAEGAEDKQTRRVPVFFTAPGLIIGVDPGRPEEPTAPPEAFRPEAGIDAGALDDDDAGED